MTLNEFARSSGTQCPSDAPRMTSDLPAGDVIVLHDDNGRHAYHALTLAMVALDALSTDQSSRALGCAQGARYGCPKAAASSLEQIVSFKAGSFTHPKEYYSYAANMSERSLRPGNNRPPRNRRVAPAGSEPAPAAPRSRAARLD